MGGEGVRPSGEVVGQKGSNGAAMVSQGDVGKSDLQFLRAPLKHYRAAFAGEANQPLRRHHGNKFGKLYVGPLHRAAGYPGLVDAFSGNRGNGSLHEPRDDRKGQKGDGDAGGDGGLDGLPAGAYGRVH